MKMGPPGCYISIGDKTRQKICLDPDKSFCLALGIKVNVIFIASKQIFYLVLDKTLFLVV